MAQAFSIDPGTFPKLRKRIKEMRERAESLGPLLNRRAALLSTVIDDAYQKGRSPLGEVWPALSEKTIDRRRKGSSKPLIDTGQMRVQSHARAGDKKIVFGVAGAAAKYAVFHVTGTGDMPRRSPFPMDEEGKADFSSGPAQQWLEKTVNDVVEFVLRGENQR